MKKSKDLQPRLLYPVRLPFKIEEEIRSFPDKKKLEFVNNKPVLQQMHNIDVYWKPRTVDCNAHV